MGCEAQRENLVAHLYGELPPDEARAFEAHRSQCSDCQREYEALAKVSRAMQNWHLAEEPWTVTETAAAPRGRGLRSWFSSWWSQPVGLPRWAMGGALAMALAAIVVANQLQVFVDRGDLVVRWGERTTPSMVAETAGSSDLAPAGMLGLEGDYLVQQVSNMISESEQRQLRATEKMVGYFAERLNQERENDLRTVSYRMGTASDQTYRELDRTNRRLDQMAQILAASEARRPPLPNHRA